MRNLLNNRRTLALTGLCILIGIALLRLQTQRRPSHPLPPEQVSGDTAPKISNGTAPPEKSPAEVTVPIDSQSSGAFAENCIAVTVMPQIAPNPAAIPGPPAPDFKEVTAGEITDNKRHQWTKARIQSLTAGMDAYTAAKFLWIGYYNRETIPYIRALAERALAENPDDFDTLYLWTILQPDGPDHGGHSPQREVGYRKLLGMNPNSADALIGLGQSIYWLNPEEAILHLEKAQRLNPGWGEFVLAKAYERAGAYNKAVALLEKIIEKKGPRRTYAIKSTVLGQNILATGVKSSAQERAHLEAIKAGKPLIPLLVHDTAPAEGTGTAPPFNQQTDSTSAFPENAAMEPPDRTIPPAASTPDALQNTGGLTEAEMTEIKHFINNMTDAQAADLERFIRAEFPELAEFLDAPVAPTPPDSGASQQPTAPELPGNFSPERLRNAQALLKRYGQTEGLRRLRKQDPELAKQVARSLKHRKRITEAQENSPPTED